MWWIKLILKGGVKRNQWDVVRKPVRSLQFQWICVGWYSTH